MKRRNFIASLVGLIPAVHIGKQLIPFSNGGFTVEPTTEQIHELVVELSKHEIPKNSYFVIDPAGGGDFSSLAIWEAKRTGQLGAPEIVQVVGREGDTLEVRRWDSKTLL